jgi:hypothetical protein
MTYENQLAVVLLFLLSQWPHNAGVLYWSDRDEKEINRENRKGEDSTFLLRGMGALRITYTRKGTRSTNFTRRNREKRKI